MWQTVCSLLLMWVSGRENVREGSNRVSFLGDLGGNVRGVKCPGRFSFQEWIVLEGTTRGGTVRWGVLSAGELSGGSCPGGNLAVIILGAFLSVLETNVECPRCYYKWFHYMQYKYSKSCREKYQSQYTYTYVCMYYLSICTYGSRLRRRFGRPVFLTMLLKMKLLQPSSVK